MKKLFAALSTLVLFGFAGSASAQIAGSAHDPSSLPASDGICIYCHTPHNAYENLAPLWNREDPVGPFTMYASSTIDMTVASSPQGVSAACDSLKIGEKPKSFGD